MFPQSLHSLLRRALVAFVSTVVGFFILWTGHHLIDSEFAVRATARLLSPILASFYKSEASKASTVVLVDEQSLAASKTTWPPPYGYHADVLEAVATYRPKAIFIDIAFLDERKDASAKILAQTFCDLARQGIQIYLAANVVEGQLKWRSDFHDCVTPVAVEYRPDSFDHVAWEYPLAIGVGDKAVNSAALALYRALPNASILSEEEAKERRMALVWGVHGSSDDRQAVVNDQGEPICDIYADGNSFGVLRLMLASTKPACPSPDTLRAYEFRSPDVSQATRLRRVIENRVIFYGTELLGTGDFVVSPLHGRIAGTYLHAMAYDNLLTYQDSWKRAAEFKISHEDINYVLVVILMVFVTVFVVNLFPHHEESDGLEIGDIPRFACRMKFLLLKAGKKLFRFLCLAICAGVLMFVAHRLLDLGILAYAELVLATLTAHYLHLGEGLTNILFGKETDCGHSS